jgi:hypothetical protein
VVAGDATEVKREWREQDHITNFGTTSPNHARRPLPTIETEQNDIRETEVEVEVKKQVAMEIFNLSDSTDEEDGAAPAAAALFTPSPDSVPTSSPVIPAVAVAASSSPASSDPFGKMHRTFGGDALEGKTHGVGQNLGQLQASNRDFQSNFWANLKTTL